MATDFFLPSYFFIHYHHHSLDNWEKVEKTSTSNCLIGYFSEIMLSEKKNFELIKFIILSDEMKFGKIDDIYM